MPLTILQTPADTEILILEMGDNNMGEIAALCQIAAPVAGLITNIGKDHLEGFGSFENNLRAKSELFDYLLKTDGIAFINSNDALLKNMSKRFKKPIMYGHKNDFSYLKKKLIKVLLASKSMKKVITQLCLEILILTILKLLFVLAGIIRFRMRLLPKL